MKWRDTISNEELLMLRDEFAKAAITGILSGKWGQMPQYKPEEAFADFAYRVADEMIKRRKKQ
jgi:hypothetical protein